MGGAISVESEPSRGSRFTFTIRVLHPGPSEASPLRHEPLFSGRRVFAVIEKERDALHASRFLAEWGISCVLTRSRADAHQEMLVAAPVDLLLLVPTVNGVDSETLAVELRGIAGTTIPVLCVEPAYHFQANQQHHSPQLIRLIKPLRLAPVLSTRQQLRSAPSVPSISLNQSLSSAAPLRVLLAEDNPVNQRLIARLLEKMGHTVTVACDGHKAFEFVQHQPFDLVIMDMQMPVMDVLEATRKIRSFENGTGQHLPIFALTANALDEDRKLCLRAGMDSFLAKPVSPPMLRAEIERVFSRAIAPSAPSDVAPAL